MVGTAAKTYPPMPGATTAGSAGYDVDSPLFRGVFVKKDTPAERVAILSDATQKALQSAEWHEFSKRFSQIEAPGGPEATDAALQKEIARWQDYLKSNP
jgi:tripartite-type tricarboxylate transporter receptor subunit TctC